MQTGLGRIGKVIAQLDTAGEHTRRARRQIRREVKNGVKGRRFNTTMTQEGENAAASDVKKLGKTSFKTPKKEGGGGNEHTIDWEGRNGQI